MESTCLKLMVYAIWVPRERANLDPRAVFSFHLADAITDTSPKAIGMLRVLISVFAGAQADAQSRNRSTGAEAFLCVCVQ